MEKIRQVIIRNTPEKGLDIVATTFQKSQIQDISLFLPEKKSIDFNGISLTKFQHSSGNIFLRFLFDDGTDKFGRESIKTHTLIIDNSFYNEKTAQYFISPLINGTMNTEENNILKATDFEPLETTPVSSKLIEHVYCKKQVQLTSDNKIDVLDLIQIFGTIDRAVPPPLNQYFSFQTMVSPNHTKSLKSRSIVFSDDKLPRSQSIDQIQERESEFVTIRKISESISDLFLLRQLQKQIFLGIPERWLNIKLQRRFGIKKFSHIRKNIDSYFL